MVIIIVNLSLNEYLGKIMDVSREMFFSCIVLKKNFKLIIFFQIVLFDEILLSIDAVGTK